MDISNWLNLWSYICVAVWLRVNWKIALVLLPLSFGALGWLTVDIEKIFGRAYPAYPTGEWVYLFHKENGGNIDLLVLDKDGTRLYTIPINEENREQLSKMGDKQAGTGVPQVGKFKKEGFEPKTKQN